jgi:hypothetical protein
MDDIAFLLPLQERLRPKKKLSRLRKAILLQQELRRARRKTPASAALNVVSESDADGLSMEEKGPPLTTDAVTMEEKGPSLAGDAATAEEQGPSLAGDAATAEEKEPPLPADTVTTGEKEPPLVVPGQASGEGNSAAASHGQVETPTEETTAAAYSPVTAADEACKDGKTLENQGSPHSGPGDSEAAIPGTADGNIAGELSGEDAASGQSRWVPSILLLVYGGILLRVKTPSATHPPLLPI